MSDDTPTRPHLKMNDLDQNATEIGIGGHLAAEKDKSPEAKTTTL